MAPLVALLKDGAEEVAAADSGSVLDQLALAYVAAAATTNATNAICISRVARREGQSTACALVTCAGRNCNRSRCATRCGARGERQ